MTLDRAGTLLRTPLYGEHLALGARMVPFAGWEMPVQYSGIIEEHRAVRGAAGMFDVSHMGRFEVHGREAARFLRYICTWDMTSLAPGGGHYAVACREDGGVLDDVYVFAVPPTPQGAASSATERYMIVVNASNAPKMRAWMERHIGGFEARLVDRHHSTAMIAVQGPAALDRLDGLLGTEFVRSLKPRRCGETHWRGRRVFASRTGYTGEDGLELVVEADGAADLWRALMDAGVVACGLGARDTLRLEAALVLYGNDMDEETNPYDAGLSWVVSLDDGGDFIGREALSRIAAAPRSRELVCLRATERGVMRPGCAVLDGGHEIGRVTSGTFSPTLETSIGMAFLPPGRAAPGTPLTVDVRGRALAVEVAARPFYTRKKQGL